ncbi:sensor histidine kinase [Marinobacter sp. X15-166B]|uniref:sensor histidine kinase n=1 Tax=Marinobacter sp. X15-166B TaxID=1897620 RepID=UPI00085CD51B|nr:ATP-binding protein [Marinobacter sp. X15-166B]OEY65308.1 two-component sensor histidine kinase [Marinobacter sp. X15-166B]
MNQRFAVPLFWRIFVLIWLAMAATVIISNAATRQLQERERTGIERQIGLRNIGMDAIRIQQQQGRAVAWRYLKQQGRELELRLVLLDARQREAGSDSHLPRSVRERLGAGWYRHRPAVIALTPDYSLVAWPQANGAGWLDFRVTRWLEMLVGFVLISLACWWIARWLSRPLQHVEHTARAIADGTTSLRVSPRIAARRDEIGALARAFNDMTDQLCQLLARQKHLLRDISHDLRTPLTRQRIAIELLSESGSDAELTDSVLRQNERLETMTAQILTLYRVTEQGQSLPREPVRPVDVLQRVLEDAAGYAAHQNVACRLTFSPASHGMTVLGNDGLLQRAFENVLQNAIDYTPPGQDVEVTVTDREQQLYCEIRDHGPGLPETALEQVFEPFYRGDQSRSGKGWGLGLAIAKDIARLHDGDITARNGAGGGLVVALILPVFTSVEPS